MGGDVDGILDFTQNAEELMDVGAETGYTI